MTGRTLVLLRHGRTAYNHARRVQGQTDVPLDEVGHAQAKSAAAVLAGLEPQVLWVSDLERTRQTAGYLATEAGLEPVLDPRLREFHLGEREGATHEEWGAEDADGLARFRRGDYDAVPGGERTATVRERMRAVLTDLLVATPDGGCSVAVSHGAALRVGVAAALGWEDDAYAALGPLDNCGWVVLREHLDRGDLRLHAWNRAASA